jgi:hypothetical protein
MADPLVEVAVRMYADFADRASLAEVLAVVARARIDLDTPSTAALPELVERLARQRLADGIARTPPDNDSTPAEYPAEPTGETGSSAPCAAGICKPIASRWRS